MSTAIAGASAEERPQADAETTGHRIIKEVKDNDIKDYAETTMNELLGWYGYDKLDTRGINLKNLGNQFPTTSSSSSSPMRLEDDASEDDTGHSVSPTAENESIPSNASGGGNAIVCAWCMKMGLKLFTLKTASGETKEFCSEPCFNQCRRAAFKKSRVCNWCRHVRHTVNYVDFQDGDDQLQFCSDKCLNQYKMQIFCKETQAYLQMNPHLQEETSKNTANSKLITPDLWLRDCQESTNGGISHSSDEVHTKSGDKDLEDLSVTSKTEHSVATNPITLQEREIHKNISVPIKNNLSERCNTLASYLTDEKDKNDRRKRHHEISRDSSRKRQRMPSFKHKISHHPEAPPAHLSSTPSTLPFQNQNSIFPPGASFPLPLRSKSPVVNPPAAHSKSFNPHPSIVSSVLHAGLPPPPPLLNNDFYHSSFNSPLFPPQQQQLDAVLRMQAGFAPNIPFTSNFFHESMLPFIRGTAQPNTTPTVPHTNTMMLPYPIFVPLPVPIPIPLPLTSFLPKDKKTEKPLKEPAADSKDVDNKDSEAVSNELVNDSKDDSAQTVPCCKNQATPSLSTNSDCDEPKLLKKSKKR